MPSTQLQASKKFHVAIPAFSSRPRGNAFEFCNETGRIYVEAPAGLAVLPNRTKHRSSVSVRYEHSTCTWIRVGEGAEQAVNF